MAVVVPGTRNPVQSSEGQGVHECRMMGGIGDATEERDVSSSEETSRLEHVRGEQEGWGGFWLAGFIYGEGWRGVLWGLEFRGFCRGDGEVFQ